MINDGRRSSVAATITMLAPSVGLNRKYRKNSNFCILVPKILSSLGSSQFRFQYQSFRFHLIWSWNWTEMEPKWNQNSTKMRQLQNLKTLYRNPGIENKEPELRYQNRYRGTAGTEASVPKPGLNWKIRTVPTLLATHFTMWPWYRQNSPNPVKSLCSLEWNLNEDKTFSKLPIWRFFICINYWAHFLLFTQQVCYRVHVTYLNKRSLHCPWQIHQGRHS